MWTNAAVGLVLLGAGAAAAQDVSYNALPGVNFAQFKTYRWVTVEGASKPDQITDQQIVQAFDAQLAAKGLTKATGETADLFIAYQAALDQEKRLDTYTTGGMGWGWGYGYPGGMGMGSSTTTSTTIQIGTITLDIYSAAAKQLVWRGIASKTIDVKAKPEKRQKNLAKAAEKMLTKVSTAGHPDLVNTRGSTAHVSRAGRDVLSGQRVICDPRHRPRHLVALPVVKCFHDPVLAHVDPHGARNPSCSRRCGRYDDRLGGSDPPRPRGSVAP
jgi:hypothetical protein